MKVLIALRTSGIPRQLRSVFRAIGGPVLVACVLSGCAANAPSASNDPQQQFVVAQRNANAQYYQSLLAYKPFFENPGGYSQAQVLAAYGTVLYQYSLAVGSWMRAIYPATRQALPASLQPLTAPSEPPTLASANRAYEHALGMNAAAWDISMAADFGKPSKLPVPRYDGPILIGPALPPLPPLQDVRDPKFARLVTMTRNVDDAQKADLAQQRAATDKQLAETAVFRAMHDLHGQGLDQIDPRTGRPYPPAQQDTQRWCMMGGGRVPC